MHSSSFSQISAMQPDPSVKDEVVPVKNILARTKVSHVFKAFSNDESLNGTVEKERSGTFRTSSGAFSAFLRSNILFMQSP